MKTNIFFLMSLLLVCSTLYAQTPDSMQVVYAEVPDSANMEMVPDTVDHTASANTDETVTYHPIPKGVPTGESGLTYQSPNLRYSNQVRVGNVSFERRNENPKPSAEPNIPMTTPDGRTINSNSKAGAGFSMSWGK